jgi:hypothetical protein
MEKRDGLEGPMVESPIGVVVLAIESVERSAQDVGREARGVWKPVTIRSDDIEGQHRNQKSLR